MKVLIIYQKSIWNGDSISYRYIPPLGLAYISSTLKTAGHAVTCLNLNHYNGTMEKLVANHLAEEGNYDIVCAGGHSSDYIQIKRIVKTIKSSGTKPKIILGGSLVSSEPELIFNALNPDYIVLGEGEETVKELANCIEQQQDPANVAGIGYLHSDGHFVKTATRKPIENLDSIPWPDFDGFEYETYLNNLKPTDFPQIYDWTDHPRAYAITLSRSCPFRCTFCYHPLGNKYRQRSMESVKQELQAVIHRYRINVLLIYDELLSNNAKRVYEFCEMITDICRNVSWDVKWECVMRVDPLDDDMLVAMKSAGCIEIGFGFESYSPAVLKSMKKHITPAQIKHAVDMCLSNNISFHANFIFGDRAETLQTVRQTLDFCKSIECANIMLATVCPYPGTELYAYCIEKGIIKDKLAFLENCMFDHFNMAENMSERDYYQSLVEIIDCVIRYYPIAVPSAVSRHANGTYSFTITCPHCAHEVHYGNYIVPNARVFNMMTYCRHCRRRFWMSSATYLFMTRMMRALFFITPMWLKIRFAKCYMKLWSWFRRKKMLDQDVVAKVIRLVMFENL